MANDSKPAPSPSQEGASPELPLVVKQQEVFKDKLTGEVMSWTKIHEHLTMSDNLMQKLAQGRQAFKQALK